MLQTFTSTLQWDKDICQLPVGYKKEFSDHLFRKTSGTRPGPSRSQRCSLQSALLVHSRVCNMIVTDNLGKSENTQWQYFYLLFNKTYSFSKRIPQPPTPLKSRVIHSKTRVTNQKSTEPSANLQGDNSTLVSWCVLVSSKSSTCFPIIYYGLHMSNYSHHH